MSIPRVVTALFFAVSTASCSLPETVARLEDHAPAPTLGRPGFVQGVARTGAYVGGVVGGVGALVTYPVLKALTYAAGDALGADGDDLVFAPVAIGAGAGHFVFGAPFDALSWVFVPSRGAAEGPSFETAVPPVGPGPAVADEQPTLVDVTDEEGDGL
jgi:hypothetical protein